MATIQSIGLAKNFIERGESYKAGMDLLIKHLTESEWKEGNCFSARLDLITEKTKALYEDYENNLKDKEISFEAGYLQFNYLIASYISILDYYTTLKNPFQSLRDAELCVVWQTGREAFNTPVSFAESLVNLKLDQYETPLADSNLLSEEYSTVSQTLWLKSLPLWQQGFIKKHKEKLSGKSIPSSLRSVPGLANASFHECKINEEVALFYFRHATQLPIDLLEKKETDDEQFRLTCINLASQIRLSISEKVDDLKTSELVVFSQSLLSPGWASTVKSEFFTSASDNDTLLYEMKERAVELFQRALSKPNAEIDARDSKIKALFFTNEGQETTLYYKDFLAKFDLIVSSDDSFKYKQYKPVKITLLSTNHPFNILRRLGVYPKQTRHNETNTVRLLGAVARYLSYFQLTIEKDQSKWQDERISQILGRLSLPELDSLLKELIEKLNSCENEKKMASHRESIIKVIENLLSIDIQALLDKNTLQLLHALRTLFSTPEGQGVLSGDERHKPQLSSVAEAMIVNCLKGAVWVACKSGKDRTGGASIIYDAAAIYYQQNKKFPQYHDNPLDREGYLKICDTLFKSGHQQRVASENAPGASGLVKPNLFFPSDLKLDVKRVERETQLARLNKPKAVKNLYKASFYHQALKKDLQDIKDKTVNVTLGESVALGDWRRNWGSYFINGKSVQELRENKRFKNEKDLSGFIKTHLLAQIESEELKKYYQALVLYSFHQGGFPHTFCKISMELMNEYYQQHDSKAIIGQADIHINFSWLEDRKGIQIEEINTFKKKKFFDQDKGDYVVSPEEGDYFCQAHACIWLKLNEIKDKGYKLVVGIQSAHVDCADELKSLFFKRLNLLEAFIRCIQSLLTAIKCYFNHLIKPQPILNEAWVSNAHLGFFKRSTEKNEEGKNTLQLNSVLQACSPSILNDSEGRSLAGF